MFIEELFLGAGDTWAPPKVERMRMVQGGRMSPEMSGDAEHADAFPRDAQPEVVIPEAVLENSTTVVLHGIPSGISCGKLSRKVNSLGFQGCCDIIHFPPDGVSGATLNFRTPDACERFVDHVHGAEARKVLGRRCGQAILRVEYASFQGRDACLANFGTTPLAGELLLLDSSDGFKGLRADAPDFVPCSVPTAASSPDLVPVDGTWVPEVSVWSEAMPPEMHVAGAAHIEAVLNAQRFAEVEAAKHQPATTSDAADVLEPPKDVNALEARQGEVLKQVEYYFSAANVVQDTYLRSLMDQDGWVDLQALVQFPRLQKLGATAENAPDALLCSLEVEVCSERTHVRQRCTADQNLDHE